MEHTARALDQMSQDALADVRSAQSAFEYSRNTEEAEDAFQQARAAHTRAADAFYAACRTPGPEIDEMGDIKRRVKACREIMQEIGFALDHAAA